METHSWWRVRDSVVNLQSCPKIVEKFYGVMDGMGAVWAAYTVSTVIVALLLGTVWTACTCLECYLFMMLALPEC